jgi:hypothetical protein
VGGKRGAGWREEVLLQWPSGCDSLVMIEVKGIQLKRSPGMVLMHGEVGLVEGVFVDVRIVFPVTMRRRRAVRSWDLGGEVGWSLWGLSGVSSYLRCGGGGRGEPTRLSSMLVFRTCLCT